MRPIRNVLRLIAEGQHSRREVANICGISRPTVDEYEMRRHEAGLVWPFPEDLDDASLEARLFPLETKQASSFQQQSPIPGLHWTSSQIPPGNSGRKSF